MANMQLSKIEDAERNLVEAEKLQKKFPPGDAETKKHEDDCKQMRDELAKYKKAGGATGAAPAGEVEKKKPQAQIAPETNYKLVFGVAAAAGVLAVLAYNFMKNRN